MRYLHCPYFVNDASVFIICFSHNAYQFLIIYSRSASQPRLMGTYSLTASAVIFVVFTTSVIIMWNTTTILIALGQPIEVSKMAGKFIRYLLPGIPFSQFYEIIRKVLQARNKTMPQLLSTVASIVVNIGLGYYLVHWTGWGWMGAAIAKSVGHFVLVPTVFVGMLMGQGGSESGKDCSDDLTTNYDELDTQLDDTQQFLEIEDDDIKNDEEDENEEDDLAFYGHFWEGFIISDALSCVAITEFLSLGFAGMCQVMFEWIAFEAIALMCGLLPGKEAIIAIGANTIIMYVSNLAYSFYLGVSVSGNVRVGNALGAGDPHRAEIASNLALGAGAFMAMINMVVLVATRKTLPLLFTTDLDIVNKAQHLFLIAAAIQLPDALNAAIQGLLLGSGRQALGAKWNFCAYYIIGIPLGYFLGVKLGLGVEGLWVGLCTGLSIISIGCTIIVLRSDWKKLANDASLRLRKLSSFNSLTALQ